MHRMDGIKDIKKGLYGCNMKEWERKLRKI